MFKLSKLIVTSIVSALLAFPLTSKAEELNSLIGVKHPPLPEEFDKKAGWLIDDTYSITSVSVDGQELLLLDRFIDRDSKDKALFQVVNVLPLPLIDDDTEGVFAGAPYQCRIDDGEYDPTLIVIAQLEDGNTEFLTKVRKAWRVELEAEKFNEINVQGLEFKCENMGFGL